MEDNNELLAYTTKIVAAYLENNEVSPSEIHSVISSVYGALVDVEKNNDSHTLHYNPAIAIEDSVQDDYVVCLEDGKKLKMLKRHLKTTYDMSPDDYRRKWKLPSDYPMVAPNYAKQRSKLAKKIGLGKQPK